MSATRREVLAGLAALTAGTPLLAHAQQGDVVISLKQLMKIEGVPDRFLGVPEAKVIVVEYASPTCPHCAAFNVDTMPEFKATYIDTGAVRFTLRPFLRNPVDAYIFLLAHAKDDQGYYDLLDTYFHTQDQWLNAADMQAAIDAIAIASGLTAEAIVQAASDAARFEALQATDQQGAEEFRVPGTPTFFIQGKQRVGVLTMADLSAEIEPLLVPRL